MVALVKWIFQTVGHQILLTCSINIVIKIKVISRSRSFKCECLDFYHEAGGQPSTECMLVIF